MAPSIILVGLLLAVLPAAPAAAAGGGGVTTPSTAASSPSNPILALESHQKPKFIKQQQQGALRSSRRLLRGVGAAHGRSASAPTLPKEPHLGQYATQSSSSSSSSSRRTQLNSMPVKGMVHNPASHSTQSRQLQRAADTPAVPQQQQPGGSSSGNNSNALRAMFLQQVVQGASPGSPVTALQEHLQARMAAQLHQANSGGDSSSSSSDSMDAEIQEYGLKEEGSKADAELGSWESLMAGLRRIPQLAGFAQLGLSMQVPASHALSNALATTPFGVAFIPSNRALAAHLLGQSALHCRQDPLSARCAGSPQQLLQQVAPGVAAGKAPKQERASNSSGEEGGMVPYAGRESGVPLAEEAALKVIAAAAAQPAKVAVTLMRHVFPLYQPSAVDEDGPAPHLRTTWPDRSGALLLQNLWDTYIQVSAVAPGPLAATNATSSSSSTPSGNATTAAKPHQPLLLGGGINSISGPVDVGGVWVYTLDGVLTEDQEVVNRGQEGLVRQVLGLRPEDEAAAAARRRVSLWLQPSVPGTPSPGGATFTGSIIPNLQTISTLDQYSDQLPYLLTTLPSLDDSCSSHQCCHHLQQQGQKEQQQGQKGPGLCPLQGLPSKLLVAGAQLDPLLSLAQQPQQQQEGPDKAPAAASSGKSDGATKARGLLQLQHRLVYGSQDVPVGVIPAAATNRRRAAGPGGLWRVLDGTSRQLSEQQVQNQTAKAGNGTAPGSSSDASRTPAGNSGSSSDDEGSAAPQAAADSPSESAQPPGVELSEAMAVLQWPRPSSTSATSAAAAGGRQGSAAGVPSFNQRMQQQQGTAGSAASAAAAAAAVAQVDSQLPSGLNEEDVAYMTLTQLSGLLRSGQVTPQQLVTLYEARLTRYQSVLLTATVLTTALANKQAAAATPQLSAAPTRTLLRAILDNNTHTTANSSVTSSRAGDNSSWLAACNSSAGCVEGVGALAGLLQGVPYGLKDVFSVPGYPTAWGLGAFRDRVINNASWVYTALSSAGAVLTSKTATGELSWGDTWWAGTTRNPWDPSSGSCGSSAGSAAAVVAGLLPYAIGSETWGSILCPAITTGATAYRPTGELLPLPQTLQLAASLDKPGVFCRQAFDCASVIATLANQAPHGEQLAAGLAKAALQAYTQPLAAAAAASGAGCVGYVEGSDPEFLATLKDLGFCIKGPLPEPVPADLVEEILNSVLNAEVASSFEPLWLQGLIPTDSYWYVSILQGQLLPATAYLKAQRLRAAVELQVQAYFQQAGITVLVKPPRTTVGLDGFASMLGMPELVVPVGTGAPASAAGADAGDAPAAAGEAIDGPSSEVVMPGTAPPVNCLISLAGQDGAAVAVAVAYQRATSYHLQRPVLPEVLEEYVMPPASG